MSSFKRRTASKSDTPTGTKLSGNTVITSTGIASLDDILGGGLPISCSLLILAPDPHSAYAQLVQRYFIAQGLVSGHSICLVDDKAHELLNECMWKWKPSSRPEKCDDQGPDQLQDDQLKIAWRYEAVKPFQTTVDQSTDEFCETFDLTCRVPRSVVDNAVQCKQITIINVLDDPLMNVRSLLGNITDVCKYSNSISKPLRICIPSLGSPVWGDLIPQTILYFLHALRGILRQYSNVCAAVSLAPFVASDSWGGYGWSRKLGWATDAAITLDAFTANPSLSNMFPSYHGLVHIDALPMPHTILSASDKFSALRGLSSALSSSYGSGENNLAFKCTRKKMVFETLHLDLEGGVGERRTTASTSASILATSRKGEAAIKVGIEEGVAEKAKTNVKKRVGFATGKADVYDF